MTHWPPTLSLIHRSQWNGIASVFTASCKETNVGDASRAAPRRQVLVAQRTQPSIGIVVPVLNEVAILERALLSLRRVAGECPVVVVDGGSTDGSAAIARRFFRTEVCPEASRGKQLNQGARCLGTDVFLFLHAVSQLPMGFQFEIARALRDPRVAGGCFRLRFDAPHAMLRFYAWFTQFSSRFCHFGGQGFFVRREVFEKLQGYCDVPLMEDVDFLRRLRRQADFAVLAVPVVTSARRFLRRGVVRQQALNILLVSLFELSIPPQRLAAFYPHIR
ncbi:MAG: TIGR04283 family arsenosugar biosynthesis glycosyltransferase [Acidobacteria bacterium]|nr:TIGR04283 family arsenosugar biosynthesis glycosyltransferase [Acidobacteriota bacterium]MCI0723889.1 TIGR04283 family arsenosugar biosynthesis glycosyltransferase [Acidobacteriota bacterium]